MTTLPRRMSSGQRCEVALPFCEHSELSKRSARLQAREMALKSENLSDIMASDPSSTDYTDSTDSPDEMDGPQRVAAMVSAAAASGGKGKCPLGFDKALSSPSGNP
jgi:hypothetical protein